MHKFSWATADFSGPSISKWLLVSAIAILLAGCTSSSEFRTRLHAESEEDLCWRYMKTLTANIYHNHIEAVIRERNLDCSRFGNVAEEKRKTDQESVDRQAEIRRLLNPQPQGAQVVHYHHLTSQWLDRGGMRLCRYSDGSVLNMGAQICALTK